MIKAVMTINDRPTVLLGLTAENMSRLMIDKPIIIKMQDMQRYAEADEIQDILIIGGETEEAIAEQIRSVMPEAFAAAQADGRVHGLAD